MSGQEQMRSRMRPSDYDLPLSRFEPMDVIGRHGSCPVNDIAEDLAITVEAPASSSNRSLRVLPAPSRPDDGRSSIIELTSAGRRLQIAATATVGCRPS